jgi:uncharacterized OB-fold protein
MSEWLKDVEPLTLKGQIAVPYSWWAGETASRFLVSLRDDKKILGAKCSKCGTVYVPPRKNCGRCFVDINEWVNIADEGVVEAYTVVHYANPIHPAKAPFAYALIKLDGADVSFLHVIKNDLDKLKKGVMVKALFKAERTGSILDIDSFELSSAKGGK